LEFFLKVLILLINQFTPSWFFSITTLYRCSFASIGIRACFDSFSKIFENG